MRSIQNLMKPLQHLIITYSKPKINLSKTYSKPLAIPNRSRLGHWGKLIWPNWGCSYFSDSACTFPTRRKHPRLGCMCSMGWSGWLSRWDCLGCLRELGWSGCSGKLRWLGCSLGCVSRVGGFGGVGRVCRFGWFLRVCWVGCVVWVSGIGGWPRWVWPCHFVLLSCSTFPTWLFHFPDSAVSLSWFVGFTFLTLALPLFRLGGSLSPSVYFPYSTFPTWRVSLRQNLGTTMLNLDNITETNMQNPHNTFQEF